ncbi:MAG: 50S ribosomal protein L1 [Candidatus Bathyarchaeota archaeon]|nr:50S ribosomal protein L1 [Candidatus Bathyarchaeota archaeon]MCX8177726.1 50S ribosomal protein L1 [Candidatus Bathyarchaeota archaeon]MDW8193987.1 50S ribosomal protein L1 [Nitrososphaerota archaeon]
MPLEQKTILEAVKEAKEKAGERKFTQSVELILNLQDIDMKSPEGKLHENIQLPHPLPGKENKICVIAAGELALKAKKANADLVMSREELEGLAGKKKDLRKIANEYDFFLVEAPLMPLAGKVLGSALGPRGKMPVPVPPTADINSLIERYRKTVAVRIRNQPIIQCRVGTEKMKDEEIAENIQTIIRAVEAKMKRGIKNIKSICIKTSMGNPVKIKP